MPLIELEDVETGERVELAVTMGAAGRWSIGKVRRVNGRALRRLPSVPDTLVPNFVFASRQPRKDDPDAPHRDPKGRVAFTKRAELDRYCKAKEARNDPIQFTYD